MERAKDVTRGALDEMKTTADFNYAVLALMQDKISERSDASMFADAIEKKKKRDNKRVKKAVLIVWKLFGYVGIWMRIQFKLDTIVLFFVSSGADSVYYDCIK